MLHIERRGTSALWTIDRPQAKNALDRATMEALLEAAKEARQDAGVRAVVLTGAGGAFVSGGDLRELQGKNSVPDAESFADAGRAVCAALEGLAVPVIAAIAGPAFGGGAELALACDLRVGDPTASLSFKQVRMGVTTAWGSIGRLVGAVGTSGAARLLYTGQALSAVEAAAMGLLDAVSPAGGAVEMALAWAADVALGAPGAVAEMKALVREARAKGGAAELGVRERARFVATWSGAEHVEAMDAFFAKRAAKWAP